MPTDPNAQVALSPAEAVRLAETLATCPFVGSAVASGTLKVRNDSGDPLASIEDVRNLGNSGGGDLGEVLALFAAGNQAFMRGGAGKLDRPAPNGLFSLEFPGSQGAHPGHSGILMGDPDTLGSGRFSRADYERLTVRATDGVVKRSDVGRFIAENLMRDRKAKVFEPGVAKALGGDIVELGSALLATLFDKLAGGADDKNAKARPLSEKFTKLLGEDNLLGSAGEFGLLFALVANKPGAKEVDGEPAVSVQDLDSMFIDKRLPDGFETWRKSRGDWMKNTTALAAAAAKEYRKLTQERDGGA